MRAVLQTTGLDCPKTTRLEHKLCHKGQKLITKKNPDLTQQKINFCRDLSKSVKNPVKYFINCVKFYTIFTSHGVEIEGRSLDLHGTDRAVLENEGDVFEPFAGVGVGDFQIAVNPVRAANYLWPAENLLDGT